MESRWMSSREKKMMAVLMSWFSVTTGIGVGSTDVNDLDRLRSQNSVTRKEMTMGTCAKVQNQGIITVFSI